MIHLIHQEWTFHCPRHQTSAPCATAMERRAEWVEPTSFSRWFLVDFSDHEIAGGVPPAVDASCEAVKAERFGARKNYQTRTQLGHAFRLHQGNEGWFKIGMRYGMKNKAKRWDQMDTKCDMVTSGAQMINDWKIAI